MKLNKYIFATLITSTTLFLGSCSDFLDRSPQGQFTEDDNPNALVNGKIYNVYTMMRNYNVTAGPPAFAIHKDGNSRTDGRARRSEPRGAPEGSRPVAGSRSGDLFKLCVQVIHIELVFLQTLCQLFLLLLINIYLCLFDE